jgi:curved DNA-binding protein CbpA
MVERHVSADLYATLGIAPDASREDVVRAYRRLVRTTHPDVRPADPGASGRFRSLTDAYDVLSDPVRRANYDRARLAGAAPPPGPEPSAAPPPPRYDAWDSAAAGSPPRTPPLWAGPVRVDPPPARRAGARRPVRSYDLRELASLVDSYLHGGWTGWPT